MTLRSPWVQPSERMREVAIPRATGPSSYTEEHHVVTKTVGHEETVIFRAKDGHEIKLVGWSPEAKPA